MLSISVHEIEKYSPCYTGLIEVEQVVLKEGESRDTQLPLDVLVKEMDIMSTIFLIKCFPERKALWDEFITDLLEKIYKTQIIDYENFYSYLWKEFDVSIEDINNLRHMLQARDNVKMFHHFMKFIYKALNEEIINKTDLKELFLKSIEKS